MLILLGMVFVSSLQPMSMVVSLIMITLMYTLYIYMFMGSYWFSYVLVLVVLSGILVVFTYLISLFPNESFKAYDLFFVMIIVGFIMVEELFKYGADFSFISINLWTSYIGVFNLFLVSFLLSIMIMVVWVSYIGEGAVRIS